MSTFLNEHQQMPMLDLASSTSQTLFFLNHHHHQSWRPATNIQPPMPRHHGHLWPPLPTTTRGCHRTSTTTCQHHVTNQTSPGKVDTTRWCIVWQWRCTTLSSSGCFGPKVSKLPPPSIKQPPSLVRSTGKPGVILGWPQPLPFKTRHPAYGYGYGFWGG